MNRTLGDLLGGTIILTNESGYGEVVIGVQLGNAQHLVILSVADDRDEPYVSYEIATDAETVINSVPHG